MSFISYLQESFYKMKKVSVGLSEQIFEVYKNPNEHEIASISKNFFELNDFNPKGLSKALRGILDLKTGDIFVWNANLLHSKATRAFNLNEAYSYRLIFNPKSKIINVEQLAYEENIDIQKFNQKSIQNLRNTGYKYIEWNDYSDGAGDSDKIQYDLNTMKMLKYSKENEWN